MDKLVSVSFPMLVGIRCDASIEIGAGHVMRCITLASALREKNAKCIFICCPHEGHLIEMIRGSGFQVLTLPLRENERLDKGQDLEHSHWLGASWMVDANACTTSLRGELGNRLLDWLIVDHYALDRRWESLLRASCRRIMAIDDLADRVHDCDLLLDQSLGRVSVDYEGLVPAASSLLLGPQYALLRPAFAELREESRARRKQPCLKQILVSMGGFDKDNATLSVLNELESCGLPSCVTITVVLGAQAPWIDQVRARAAQMPIPTSVLSGVSDMARLMVASDLAIGAGGTSTWERCALALPSITKVLASNQEKVAAEMEKVKATVVAGLGKPIKNILSSWAASAHVEQNLLSMSQAAAKVTDGLGVMRVASKMFEPNV